MTKKTVVKYGKALLMLGAAGLALAASAWILMGMVQLVTAGIIAGIAWFGLPVFLELLAYGQFTAMVKIWRGNPVYALQRNKEDFVEELTLRKKKVVVLGRSAHRTMSMLNEKKAAYPDLVANQMPIALKQMEAYRAQLTALERAEKIVSDYDEVIDRARTQYEMNQSLNESAGILNSLGTSHRSELRELRERVAQDELRLGTANAMAELDMLLTGMSDMKATSAGKSLEKEKTGEDTKQEEPVFLEESKSTGLFCSYNEQKQPLGKGLFRE